MSSLSRVISDSNACCCDPRGYYNFRGNHEYNSPCDAATIIAIIRDTNIRNSKTSIRRSPPTAVVRPVHTGKTTLTFPWRENIVSTSLVQNYDVDSLRLYQDSSGARTGGDQYTSTVTIG
jgi:hypothetical protein